VKESPEEAIAINKANYIIFWKRQTYEYIKKIIGCQEFMRKRDK
jgi:hypothetical protein